MQRVSSSTYQLADSKQKTNIPLCNPQQGKNQLPVHNQMAVRDIPQSRRHLIQAQLTSPSYSLLDIQHSSRALVQLGMINMQKERGKNTANTDIPPVAVIVISNAQTRLPHNRAIHKRRTRTIPDWRKMQLRHRRRAQTRYKTIKHRGLGVGIFGFDVVDVP